MIKPNPVDRPSRFAKHPAEAFRIGIWERSPSLRSPGAARVLLRRTGLKAGLKAVADTRLGHQEARAIGISFDFLPELANEDSQTLNIFPLVAAPYVLEQLVVRHHKADMRRQDMQQAVLLSGQSDRVRVERHGSSDEVALEVSPQGSLAAGEQLGHPERLD